MGRIVLLSKRDSTYSLVEGERMCVCVRVRCCSNTQSFVYDTNVLIIQQNKGLVGLISR